MSRVATPPDVVDVATIFPSGALRVDLAGVDAPTGLSAAARVRVAAAFERGVGHGLLDLMMPEMDGFAFLHRLRQNPAWRDIPVIVLTAKELSPQDHHVLRDQVEKILQKGAYRKEDLLAEVSALVRRRVAGA